ncbi:hypothetical protein BZA77DRAFT_322782 [Pyronema omphalodes]|nr:hypothetical protein BZA77DRAFT_322782 [Pyronema omphalodes]
MRWNWGLGCAVAGWMVGTYIGPGLLDSTYGTIESSAECEVWWLITDHRCLWILYRAMEGRVVKGETKPKQHTQGEAP